AHRLVKHVGFIERDTMIALLLDTRLRDFGIEVGLGASHPLHESGREQTINRLPHLELDEARLIDDPLYVSLAIDELEHRALLLGQRRFCDAEPALIDLEYPI